MTQWRLFPEGTVPEVSTQNFHAERGRAQHLEDPTHRPRLDMAVDLVRKAAQSRTDTSGRVHATLSDLGCGDGGLLSVIKDEIYSWGYDFTPANVAGCLERGVQAELVDVFGPGEGKWAEGKTYGVEFGSISVMTEVLEHLADPHGVLQWVRKYSDFLVASSPWTETGSSHDGCHAWAWDIEGYDDLMFEGGWSVHRHEKVGMFQVVLAFRR